MKFNRSSVAFLLFGFMTAFLTGPGQTYVLSLFNPAILHELAIGSGLLGSLYALATLGSALCLPLMGRLIDRANLMAVTASITLGLSAGLVLLSQMQQLWSAVFAFFCLRLFGQGSLSIIGRTVIGKKYRVNRGKAMAIIGLGHPAAEIAMPACFSLLLTIFPWRSVLLTVGGLVFLFFTPFLLFCLWVARDTACEVVEEATSLVVDSESILTPASVTVPRDWELAEVLRDTRLWFVLPGAIFPPFILTGLIFHHHYFLRTNNWSIELIAHAFVAYGFAHAVIGFLTGPLVDRFTAARLLPIYLLPSVIGLLVFLSETETKYAFLYLGLLGSTVGLGQTIKPALWPELYGVKNLGTIGSAMASIMVLSTALAPPIFGYALEFGTDPRLILRVIIIAAFFCTALMMLGLWRNNSALCHYKKRAGQV